MRIDKDRFNDICLESDYIMDYLESGQVVKAYRHALLQQKQLKALNK